METLELYQIADENDIPVIMLDVPESGSMCIQTSLRCYIGMDNSVLDCEAVRRVHLGHELGHCTTGAFYNIHAARDVRQKHENRADKWAIKKLIPKDELDKAVASGLAEPWALAEYFDVTEDFMRKAICWYNYGTLDTSQYFPL
ncbi:MAG: hypothetical protein IJO77_03785 [Oscillospiraceae bacterium]|nr:hypothetical protein [Oscillospiraceae bacterium]